MHELLSHAVFDHLKVGVLFINASNRVAFVDEVLARIKGLKPEEIIDQSIHLCPEELIHPDVMASLDLLKQNIGARIVKVFQKGELTCREVYLSVSWPGGDYMGTIMFCEVLEGMEAARGLETTGGVDEKSPAPSLRVAEDYANALQQYLGEIEKRYGTLKSSSAMKDRFLSLVAQEMKIPLTTILGYAAMIIDGSIATSNTRIQKAALAIRDKARRTRRMMEDFLELAVDREGELSTRPKPTRLDWIIDSLIKSSFSEQTQSGRIEFEMHVPYELPFLWADESLLEEALFHLISNALRFTSPGGHVLIGAAKINCDEIKERLDGAAQEVFPMHEMNWDSDRPEGFVEIWIEDDGAVPQQPTTSKNFRNLGGEDYLETIEHSDAMIGLSLAREILRAHNGLISMRSGTSGAGSRFSVFWPAAAVAGDEPYQSTTYQARPGKILVIGKRLTFDEITQLEIRNRGLEFVVAETGADGLARLNAGGVALILLHLNLPDIGGFSIIHSLKSEPDIAAIPVIALGREAEMDRLKDAVNAGAKDFLLLPVNNPRALNQICKYVM